MTSAAPIAAHINGERIGFFGFSRGGFTGLLLAGAQPDWAAARKACAALALHACRQIGNGELVDRPLARDPRIKAMVLADPGFRIGTLVLALTPDSLAAVTTPVQLWASEHAGDGLAPQDVAAIDRALPSPHEHHLVANAGHFAFMLCRPALAQRRPELCTDPPGFDRAAFHRQFNAEVLTFFRARLGARY